MCGLVSVISKKKYGFVAKDLDLFEQLLTVDVLRGDDATGVISVDKEGDFFIAKEATPAYEFLPAFGKTHIARNALHTGVALIGHNRKGTMGGRGDEAAHPFVVKDRFAMVHNGTLYGHKELAKTDVDSEALAIIIEETINSETYTKDDLGETLGRVDGAYAVIWYNQLTNMVQFVRNDQRTLYVAESDDCWILGSEAGMIQWICGRNGIKINSLEAVKEGVLHTLDLEEKDVPLLKEELSIKKYIPPTVPTATNTAGSMVARVTNLFPNDALSKNEFKRLKRKIMGKEIEFYVEDVLGDLTPRSKEDMTYSISGSCDSIGTNNHLVKGTIDVAKQGRYSIEYVDHFFFTGKVVDMDYNLRTKQAEVFVEGIKTCPASYFNQQGKPNEENSATVH